MKSLFGLEDKRFLILGGGLGMGEATARTLASLGAHVAIADREPERAQAVASGIAAEGGSAISLSVDVLDDAALIATIAQAERDIGPLDGMATVIGMAGWGTLLDMELEAWDLDHQRNLRYFFVAAREVARSLIARGAPGAMACVSSIDGTRCAPFHGSYGAAKAGLSNLAKTMSVEWGPHGIRTNVVAPGAIVTPRFPLNPDGEPAIYDRLPLGRRGTVQDIANAIVFLLSDMASYITGQTVAVDGGFLAGYLFELGVPKVARPI